jgi:hypothetical protein
MMVPEFLLKIAELVWPLPPPPLKRTRELQVLALGNPRTGTDSLHKALRILGYPNVSHGFVFWYNNVECSILYYRLGRLVESGHTPSPEVLRRDYFDRTLAHYDATTDVPPVAFAPLVLQAYPEAKVILNRRRDVQAWKKSYREAVVPLIDSWAYWFFSWFHAEFFWGMALNYQMYYSTLGRGKFDRDGEKRYHEHYEPLEAILKESNREWLDWTVEDGW